MKSWRIIKHSSTSHGGAMPQANNMYSPNKINIRYQQTWHTIEFSNNKHSRHHNHQTFDGCFAPEQLFQLTRISSPIKIGWKPSVKSDWLPGKQSVDSVLFPFRQQIKTIHTFFHTHKLRGRALGHIHFVVLVWAHERPAKTPWMPRTHLQCLDGRCCWWCLGGRRFPGWRCRHDWIARSTQDRVD